MNLRTRRNKHLMVRMSDDEHKLLMDIQKKTNQSHSDIVRTALKLYLHTLTTEKNV